MLEDLADQEVVSEDELLQAEDSKAIYELTHQVSDIAEIQATEASSSAEGAELKVVLRASAKLTAKGSVQPAKEVEPSKQLLFLISFVYSAEKREAGLGDIEERFRKDSARFGERQAHSLMIKDAVASLYPTGKAAFIKLLKLITCYEMIRKIIF